MGFLSWLWFQLFGCFVGELHRDVGDAGRLTFPFQPEPDELRHRGPALRSYQLQVPGIAGKPVQRRSQGLLELRKQGASRAACPAPNRQCRQPVGVDGGWQARCDDRGIHHQASLSEFEVPRLPQAQVVAVGHRYLHLHDGCS